MKIATLGIITRGNKLLLGLKQGGSEIGDGLLNAPGGKFEPKKDTTILKCLLRGVEEEVGIVLDQAKVEKTAVITFYAGGVPDFEVHIFRSNIFTGEPHETTSMIPDWYDIDDLPFDDMHDSDHTWFPQAVRGRKFHANVYYRERAKGFINIEFLPFVE